MSVLYILFLIDFSNYDKSTKGSQIFQEEVQLS